MFDSLLFHPSTAQAIWRAWTHAGAQPARRSFELEAVETGQGAARLHWSEEPISPFALLTRLERVEDPPERRLLLVPPMAGGFPFILRDMAASMALTARVSLVEWINARFAPSSAGSFDLDDQIDVILEALRRLGPRAHMIALCQSGPAALIAAAAADAPPCSLTLIAAPVDPASTPSMMSRQIQSRSLGFYRSQLTLRQTPDGGRRLVYPAEAQMAVLIATLGAQSPERHEFSRLILESVEAQASDQEDGPGFLEQVSSFMDLPGEFFIDSLQRIYLAADGPAAGMRHRGLKIDPAALRDTSLFAVEGSEDLVAAPGQTRAALALAPSTGRALRRARLERGVGHFGLFTGQRWLGSIARWVATALTDAEKAAHQYSKTDSSHVD